MARLLPLDGTITNPKEDRSNELLKETVIMLTSFIVSNVEMVHCSALPELT
jgi:hypothetical protein